MFKFLNINRCQAIGLQIALETANLRKKTTRVWWYAALWLKEIDSRVTPTHETSTSQFPLFETEIRLLQNDAILFVLSSCYVKITHFQECICCYAFWIHLSSCLTLSFATTGEFVLHRLISTTHWPTRNGFSFWFKCGNSLRSYRDLLPSQYREAGK